ncbi:RAD51-associated protein 1 [Discoglossus pictus]
MDRPARQKKAVDYSQFGDLDNDDEDFSCAPSSKKARVETKKEKKEKPLKKPRKEVVASPQSAQGKRVPLDDKLFHRDLEVALALSVKKTSSQTGSVEDEKEVPAFADCEITDRDTSFSNCSVDGSTLGLDEITNSKEDQADGRSRRPAASKAIKEQKRQLLDDSGDEAAEDEFKPAMDEESGSDSSFSGEDEEFEFIKTKKSKPSKSVKLKNKVEKERKNVPKPKTYESSIVSPVTIKIKSLPEQRSPVSSAASAKQVTPSPKMGVLKQKWTPPATSGNAKHPLGGVAVRSPNQGIRLGLSRLARVKPLHPTVVNN